MTWILPLACLSAAFCGVGGALGYLEYRQAQRHRQVIREVVHRVQGEDAFTLAATGLAKHVLQRALDDFRRLQAAPTRKRWTGALWSFASASFEELVQRAGLGDLLDRNSLLQTRAKLSLGMAGVGALLGAVFSLELSLVLALLGFILGFRALPWALKAEAKARSASVERDLSSMLEVVVLGLRSGLSFDRSLQLYCQYFSTPLARSMKQALDRWQWGLMTREQSLRRLAESYDSALLSRVVESTVRSLRFGVSMAAVLDEASREARDLYKTRIEEQVARAPVKMMLPVGVLILPAMLMLILGPVLLELMEGF